MSNPQNLIFPELILLNDFEGDFSTFFTTVYEIFKQDFISSNPTFNGLRVSAQKHPEVDGIHRTFYHITHEGEDEQNRIPDISRMERIKFPKFIIENEAHPTVMVWENNRGKDKRVLLFNEHENYLVVLTERAGYYLFWTAYMVTQPHRRRKLLQEYEAYIKAKTA